MKRNQNNTKIYLKSTKKYNLLTVIFFTKFFIFWKHDMNCWKRFFIVLTELREQISKHSAQEDYATIPTPDADGYQELEMSRRWLELIILKS